MSTLPPHLHACGKVILFGEHAVVYGQPALAAGIERGVTVCDLTPADAPTLELLLDIGEPLRATRGAADPLSRAFTGLYDALEQDRHIIPPQRVTLRSALPPGAGLGSSAALAVATARALLWGAGLDPADHLDSVLRAAEAAESVFHGNPSGVDHTTAALGGLLRFRRGAPPVPLTDLPKLPLIIAQLSPGADTGAMVAGVRRRRDRLPGPMDALIASLGQLTQDAEAALRSGDLEALGLLMNLAHGGLHGLGVSSEALDRGCHAARAAGALGAKLTGAGGGGCIVALAPPDTWEPVTDALRDAGALLVLPTWV